MLSLSIICIGLLSGRYIKGTAILGCNFDASQSWKGKLVKRDYKLIRCDTTYQPVPAIMFRP